MLFFHFGNTQHLTTSCLWSSQGSYFSTDQSEISLLNL